MTVGISALGRKEQDFGEEGAGFYLYSPWSVHNCLWVFHLAGGLGWGFSIYTNPDLYMIVCGCLSFGREGEGEVGRGMPAIAVACTVVGDLVGTALMEVHPTSCKGTGKIQQCTVQLKLYIHVHSHLLKKAGIL